MSSSPSHTFLFWNIQHRNIPDVLATLCFEHQIDFLLLAKSDENALLLRRLNRDGQAYWPILAQPGDLALFARHPSRLIQPRDVPRIDPTDRIDDETSNALFFRVAWPGLPFNLVLVHLRSPLRGDLADRELVARQVADRIRLFEAIEKDDTTLVVGDFNMNPFDPAMVHAEVFHAMMTRDLVRPDGRVVAGRRRPFFYNPLWARYGCESVTGRPPGGYYYARGGAVCYYWNHFDQILLRPGLLDWFDDDSLELITRAGGQDLRKGTIPDRDRFSDHLPLLFRLRLERSPS